MLWLVAAAAGACAAPQAKPAPQASSAASAARFDSNRAWEHLRRQVAFGPRPAGSTALDDCRRYLLEQLKAAGITATEQRFVAKTPLGDTRMANVVATIPGRRRERIILASHFDTKLFREFRFVGASDGGSSTAALLELARTLKDRPRPFTIELLFLDGEEAVVEWSPIDSTYGSRHYVQAARAANRLSTIKVLILLDMIGDRNLNIKRESNSTPWLTEIIWSTAHKLGHQRHFLNESTPIEDDHLPFLQAGVQAVDIIDLDYEAWHTAGDTLEAVSAQSLQVVGGVVLAALPAIEQRLLKN